MIHLIGNRIIDAVVDVGELLRLVAQGFVTLGEQIVGLKFRFRETVEQVYQMGVCSLPVMAFVLMILGVIITLEFSFHMKLVLRQDSLVPAFSTLLLIRELGPVVTCLLLCSRVGASLAAEIASMKVTDQIDALKVLAIDPVDYLLIPRWVGCIISAVSISVICVLIAIIGGAVGASLHSDIPIEQYFNTMFTFTHFSDFKWVFIKSAVFGGIIPIIAIHRGLSAHYGAEGVGNAATHAVVQGTMLIIITDFLLTYGMY